MHRFVALPLVLLVVLVGSAQAEVWDVYGQVRIYNGTCNTGIGMNGVTVVLRNTSTGQTWSTVTVTDQAFMNTHGLTSPLGIYYFHEVPYSTAYEVEVIEPLGVVCSTAEPPPWNANPRPVGSQNYRCFLMDLAGTDFSPHTIGYWKHQCTVAAGGNGHPQVPPAQLAVYFQMIYDLFNDAPHFPIAGVSHHNNGPLTPQAALATFNAPNGGSAGMVNKTRKQLLALLLNVVSEYVYVWQDISTDDRVISQAITFAADMITPAAGSAISTAQSALDKINNGQVVPAGWIPDSYELIYYGSPQGAVIPAATLPETPLLLDNYPNPFNPVTTVIFALPEAGEVTVAVYDLAGREVARLADGWREAGRHEITFDASGLASGLYLCRLTSGPHSGITRMILVK